MYVFDLTHLTMVTTLTSVNSVLGKRELSSSLLCYSNNHGVHGAVISTITQNVRDEGLNPSVHPRDRRPGYIPEPPSFYGMVTI